MLDVDLDNIDQEIKSYKRRLKELEKKRSDLLQTTGKEPVPPEKWLKDYGFEIIDKDVRYGRFILHHLESDLYLVCAMEVVDDKDLPPDFVGQELLDVINRSLSCFYVEDCIRWEYQTEEDRWLEQAKRILSDPAYQDRKIELELLRLRILMLKAKDENVRITLRDAYLIAKATVGTAEFCTPFHDELAPAFCSRERDTLLEINQQTLREKRSIETLREILGVDSPLLRQMRQRGKF